MTRPERSTAWSPRVPALDGVRGVAILAVLIGHAGLGIGSSGVLGVDVFFVLSGYLICGLLCAELDQRQTIDLGRFWLRRAGRLVPALVLVLLVIELAALLADNWTVTTKHQSLAALVFLSNWTFAANGTSYFDQYASPSPVLHTWSLGVEEQFYLLMPLICLGSWVATRGRWRSTLAVCLIATAAGSLITVSMSDSDPGTWLYYGTHARSFELAIGALAGLLLPPRRVTALGRPWLGTVSAAGGVALCLLIVILGGHLGSDDEWLSRHLVVVVLTVLVVLGASTGRLGWPQLLARGPLLWLGAISYGVYLWHWPIYLWLTPDLTNLQPANLFALRLVVTIAVAAVSYLLLERPVRTWLRHERTWAGSGSLVASMAVAAGLLLLLPSTPSLGRFIPGTDVDTTVASTTGEAYLEDDGQPAAGDRRTRGTPSQSVAPPAEPVRVFIVGDSVGMNLRQQLTPSLSRGLVVDGSTWLGCPLVPGILVAAGQVRPVDDDCLEWSRSWPEQITAFQPDLVLLMPGVAEQFDRRVQGRVLGGTSHAHQAYLATELSQLVAGLRPGGFEVALTTIPCHGAPDFGVTVDAGIINSRDRIEHANAAIWSAAQRSGARVLDLDAFLCPQGYDNTRDGITLRIDGVHFTPEGARFVWRWLRPHLTGSASEGPSSN